MAHECPICGDACHCNGDIGDLVFNDTKEALHCHHCPDEDGGDEE